MNSSSFCLFDNTDLQYWDLESPILADYCECNEIEKSSLSESEARNILSDYEYSDWRDMKEYINNSIEKAVGTYGNGSLLAVGKVQRWTGIGSGWEIYTTFEEFLQKFGKDCDYFKIDADTEKGTIQVSCSHHDGTNCCTLYLLSDKADEVYDQWLYGQNYCFEKDERKFINSLSETQLLQLFVSDKEFTVPFRFDN